MQPRDRHGTVTSRESRLTSGNLTRGVQYCANGVHPEPATTCTRDSVVRSADKIRGCSRESTQAPVCSGRRRGSFIQYTESSKAPGFAGGANPQWRPLDPYPHEH